MGWGYILGDFFTSSCGHPGDTARRKKVGKNWKNHFFEKPANRRQKLWQLARPDCSAAAARANKSPPAWRAAPAGSGLPDFSCKNGENIPSADKMYQMAIKFTNLLQNIPNCHKIYQYDAEYTKWPLNILTSSITRP
jgi:hypothetical protein